MRKVGGGQLSARWLLFSSWLLGLVLSIVMTNACAAQPREEGDEVYLHGTRGPYRGRVVDTTTKKPIAGAVVLAVWYYDVPALVQMNTKYHDALEVLSDTQGFFAVESPQIEQSAPPRTTFPVFTIFKPGYVPFEGWFASPEAMAHRQARPLLGVVELQRAEPGRSRSPFPGDQVPREKMPRLLRAMQEEKGGR